MIFEGFIIYWDSLHASWQFSTENGMSYWIKTTIQSRHGTLEQPINCTFEDIWRILYLLVVDSLHASWQFLPSKMQLTGCSRVSWLLWIVEITNLDNVLPWYDIPFSVYNRQLVLTLSIPNTWWILQMYPRMQLTGCFRAWQLWMVSFPWQV